MKNKNKLILLISIFLFIFSHTAAGETSGFETFLNSGWKAREKKNFDLAENAYRSALKINPRSPDAKVGLFYTFIEKKDFMAAEMMADNLLITNPDNLWIRKGAAWTYYNRGRYGDAIDQYDYILEKRGADSEIQLGLGLSLYRAGKKEEAQKACLKCDKTYENDPRLKFCLGKGGAPWIFTPQVYLSYTDYGDSWDKDYSSSLTAGLEAFHPRGSGVYLQVSRLTYSQKVSGEKYHQDSSSLALFHSKPGSLIWGNWTHLEGDHKGEKSADIFSLYGSRRDHFFHTGAGFDAGFYDGFETFQFTPEAGIHFAGNYMVKLVPMFQRSSGEKAFSSTEMKTRFSTALDFTAQYRPMALTASVYTGERWFTSEDKGLNVWNSDDEFEWGGKIKAVFHSTKRYSSYISVRVDKADKQFGFEHDYYVSGATVGITATF